jgi:transposase
MWHLGIDLHRHTVVVAAINDAGEVRPVVRFDCSHVNEIKSYFEQFQPFRCVIEATSTYRWLYKLLSQIGTVLLAHPFRLRAMVQRRSKTDRLDAVLLAQLLRIDQIPLAYVPSERYQMLRETTRQRCRLTSAQTQVKTSLRWLLARHNLNAPYKCPFGPRGLYWFRRMDFGPVDNPIRDELLERLGHFDKELATMDARLEALRPQYPEVEVLTELYGVGLFSAMLIVSEFGDVSRFRTAKQAGAYTGLTPKVDQSGSHCYVGHISKQGSPWLRWILLEAAMKIVRKDIGLANFYTRIRKRASAKIARVATARKLSEICWKRLRRWNREHVELAVA